MTKVFQNVIKDRQYKYKMINLLKGNDTRGIVTSSDRSEEHKKW